MCDKEKLIPFSGVGHIFDYLNLESLSKYDQPHGFTGRTPATSIIDI